MKKKSIDQQFSGKKMLIIAVRNLLSSFIVDQKSLI